MKLATFRSSSTTTIRIWSVGPRARPGRRPSGGLRRRHDGTGPAHHRLPFDQLHQAHPDLALAHQNRQQRRGGRLGDPEAAADLRRRRDTRSSQTTQDLTLELGRPLNHRALLEAACPEGSSRRRLQLWFEIPPVAVGLAPPVVSRPGGPLLFSSFPSAGWVESTFTLMPPWRAPSSPGR